jgi:phospholipid transport system substrate-binding protein
VTRAVAALVVVVLALLLLPGRAESGAPTEQLRQRVDRVLQVLDDRALAAQPEERRRRVRAIAEETFDFEETARRALGRHWRDRTPAERQEFVRLFTDLMERAYISRIEQYGGEKVVYTGETVEGDQAVVRTRIVTPQGSEIPVEYRVQRRNDRWLVHDVVIEGVSLVANYRTQFNRIITTGSYRDLVERMRTQIDAAPPAGRRG